MSSVKGNHTHSSTYLAYARGQGVPATTSKNATEACCICVASLAGGGTRLSGLSLPEVVKGRRSACWRWS
jgi:hypothetical protein